MAASLAQFGGTDNALTRAEEEHPVIMGVLTVRIHSASRLHSDDPRVFAPHSSTALAVRIETRTWTKRTHLARVDPGAGSRYGWESHTHKHIYTDLFIVFFCL